MIDSGFHEAAFVALTTATTADDEYDDYEEFDPYLFIKTLPPLSREMLEVPNVLPPKAPGAPTHTLVLDLDETLVHCATDVMADANVVFPVEFNGTVRFCLVPCAKVVISIYRRRCHLSIPFPPLSQHARTHTHTHTQVYQVYVRFRPFLREFLEAVAGDFEVVVFTASQKVYAAQMLDILDPEGRLIDHRLYRASLLPFVVVRVSVCLVCLVCLR